jgi:hypothetical protein
MLNAGIKNRKSIYVGEEYSQWWPILQALNANHCLDGIARQVVTGDTHCEREFKSSYTHGIITEVPTQA